jgi:outer membrane protein assembly factor BamB
MTRVLLTAFLCLLLVQGCKSWGNPEPGDPSPLVDFDATVKVKRIWSTGVGDGMGKAGISMPPMFVDGVIFTADAKGQLTAVGAEKGNKIWTIKTKQAFSGGPAVGESLLVMGTLDGTVLAFDAADGSERWSARVSSEVLAVPGISENIVVVRCIDGRVFGLDANTGTRVWIYDSSVPLLTLRGNTNILLRGSTVFVGYPDGTVVALKVADGTVMWSQSVVSPDGRTELERLADIGIQMVIVASDLIVSSYKKRIASLAADSGRLLWFKEIPSFTGVQVDRTNLAVSDLGGNLWLLDRRNGSTLWKIDQLTNRGLTLPAFYGDLVVVGDREGYLHWINIADGAFVAREREGKKGFASAPLTVGTTLYVLTSKGTLSAYRAGAAL